MAAVIRAVARALHCAGAVLTILMMLLVCYDVFARQLFNAPFAGTAELVATGLVLAVFLQLPYCMIERKLLRVTFLYDALGHAGRSVLNTLAWAAGTAMFGALAVTSWAPLLHALRSAEFYGMDMFRVPAWPLRGGTLVLWTVAALTCLHLAIDSARGRLSQAEDQLPD